MLGAGWLNVGSLILGFIAWILPVVNLMQRHKTDNGNWAILTAASITACAVSLCLQLFYTNHLVTIEDWSALMDTSGAVASVATFLLVVTIILNVISFITYYEKTAKDL